MENYGNFQKECVTRENFMSKNSLRGQNWKPPGRAAGSPLHREPQPWGEAEHLPGGHPAAPQATSGSSLAPRAQLKLLPGNGAKLVKYFGHKYLNLSTSMSFL